jgi:hypothetical protein
MGLAREILRSRAGSLTVPYCGDSRNGLRAWSKRCHGSARVRTGSARSVAGQSTRIGWQCCRIPGYVSTARRPMRACDPFGNQHPAVANRHRPCCI